MEKKRMKKKRIFTFEPSRVKMDEDDVANDKVRVRSERVYKMRKLLRIFKAREQKKTEWWTRQQKKSTRFSFYSCFNGNSTVIERKLLKLHKIKRVSVCVSASDFFSTVQTISIWVLVFRSDEIYRKNGKFDHLNCSFFSIGKKAKEKIERIRNCLMYWKSDVSAQKSPKRIYRFALINQSATNRLPV